MLPFLHSPIRSIATGLVLLLALPPVVSGEVQQEEEEIVEEAVSPERYVGQDMLLDLEQRLEAWRLAVETGDAQGLGEILDVRAVHRRSHALAPLDALADPVLILRFSEELLSGLTRAQHAPWTTIEVLETQVDTETDGVRLTTRSILDTDGELEVKHQRWIFKEREDQWHVVERIDLASGAALSWYAARTFAAVDDAPAWTHAIDDILRGTDALGRGDAEAVRWSLQVLESTKFPSVMDGTIHLLRGQAALSEDRLQASKRWLEEAAAEIPDVPMVFHAKALMHAQRSEWQSAIYAVEEYRKLLPCGADLRFIEGKSQAALGRREKAADAFRAGLAIDPNNVDNLLGLARALDQSGSQELREQFRRLDNPAEWFEPLVLDLLGSGDLEDVESLIHELRNIAPTDPNGDYYEATLLIQRGELRIAADLLRNAFPKVADPAELRYYVQQYADACVMLGVPMEAYEQAPDSPFVFDLLCSYFLEVGQPKEVEELAMRHELRFPDDPWLPYYRGEILRTQGNLHAAALRFEEGLLNARDAETREVYRWNLVRARVENGEALKAYREIEPHELTFSQLCQHALESTDAVLLEQLLKARRADDPQDLRLPALEGVRAFWLADYSGALDLFGSTWERLDRNEALLVPIERMFVVAAMRTGDFSLAEVEARRSTQRDGDPLLEAIAYAAQDKHKQAIIALMVCINRFDYATDSFYGDPDLGPKLRNDDAYEAFRLRFPPPK
ncbi:MAG: tetratricopeptide (TPR) repeat protein [Planctomycetota bacterium]|jgi:tetratricopeptide (TPR) repeat protein